MKKPDINFFDLASNQHYSGLLVDPSTGIVSEDGIEIFRKSIIGPDGEVIKFSDALKGSRVTDTTVENYFVQCHDIRGETASEDAIDLNNECGALGFFHGAITCGHKNGITIKGGCHDITFDDLRIFGRPHTHIDLGNHSDQSFKKSSKIEFRNIRCEDNGPVIVRVGWANKPVIVGTNVKRLVFEGGALKVYVFAKHFLPIIP